jgi:hypothetical protein
MAKAPSKTIQELKVPKGAFDAILARLVAAPPLSRAEASAKRSGRRAWRARKPR